MNDNAPVFSSTHFSFDVSEWAARGAVVGRLSATDADAPGTPFSAVSYRLASEWGADTFTIGENGCVFDFSC